MNDFIHELFISDFFSYFRLSRVQLFESDPIGHLVALIVADDKDGDKLFFSITDGDDAKDFYINPDQGNLVVASKLNFSRKKLYNLTIEITDGRQQTHANVIIDILPMVTKRPQFKQQITQVIKLQNVKKITQNDKSDKKAESFFKNFVKKSE